MRGRDFYPILFHGSTKREAAAAWNRGFVSLLSPRAGAAVAPAGLSVLAGHWH